MGKCGKTENKRHGEGVGWVSEKNEIMISIDGIVLTQRTIEEWIDDFITWLESRGEMFAGGHRLVKNAVEG